MKSIPRRVRDQLGYYVYLYIDPRDNQPFYVGKGTGNRVLVHLEDQSETEKVSRIAELRKLGQEPVIEILKYGLSEVEALLVESSAIELIGIHHLTNRVKGHGASNQGRGRIEDIMYELDAADVDICHPMVLINISRMYRYGMSATELYDATRGVWKVGPRRLKAEYACCVFGGVIRAVYSIAAWVPAGTTMTSRTYEEKEYDLSERFEFVGNLANDQLQRTYVGKNITRYFAKGAQNPIKCVNC